MIRLENTTVKLQVLLAGSITTSQLQCFVSYVDQNTQNEMTRGSSQKANTNNTTDVDICDALGTGKAGYVRNIDTLMIYNKDTVTATVTVKLDDGGTEFILQKITLYPAETLSYEHGAGWQILFGRL